MGSAVSSDGDGDSSDQDVITTDEDQIQDSLHFPAEILTKIMEHLTPRDKLVARMVCQDWNEFIMVGTNVANEVRVTIEDSENNLVTLGNSPFPPLWTDYVLRNVDLTKKSAPFWIMNSDHITRLSLVDCATSEIVLAVEANNECCSHLSCNNLLSLSLNNCGKYFMMGNKFVQIHKFLNLEKLECLDLSNNNYLNDRILFSFLVKTKCLVSLNLSDTPMTFANSVFQRFYPPRNGSVRALSYPDECSDYILSFQMLYHGFLVDNNLTELILNHTSIDKFTLKILADELQLGWTSIGLNRCNELKEVHVQEFLATQNNLQKLELEKLRITENLLTANHSLDCLKYLILRECTEITSLGFLKNTTRLEHLDISYCTGINFETSQGCLSSAPKLRVLKMRGIVAFYIHDHHTDQSSVSKIFATEFANLHKMIELDIGICGSFMTDVVLQSVIQNMPRLQKLRICKAAVTDAGLHCMKRLAGLRELSVSQCELIGESTWTQAIQFHSLRYLDVSRCLNLSKNGLLEIVGNCRSLEVLIVTNSIRVSHETQARCTIDGDSQLMKIVTSLPRLKNFVLNPINH